MWEWDIEPASINSVDLYNPLVGVDSQDPSDDEEE